MPVSTRELDEARIEEARRELEATEVGRGTAWATSAAFVLCLLAVPLADMLSGGLDPGWVRDGRPAHCRLREVERVLDEETRVARMLRPTVQSLLLLLGAGNASVEPGRDGWLFQREAVASVTGRAFTAPDVQNRRRIEGDGCTPDPHPDALEAVLEFERALSQRGSRLILLPTPAKASVEPGRLTRRFRAGDPPPRNAGFAGFVAALRERGVTVFDPLPVLRDVARTGSAYLATDTHWGPGSVEAVANGLARFLEAEGLLSRGDSSYTRTRLLVRNRGDVAALLGARPASVPLEESTIRPVLAADGAAWRPEPSAQVLLLGDSFSNVYSDREAFAREEGRLHWGEGAGLAEQLSFALQRPVDRLVRNDDGAFATRLELARRLEHVGGSTWPRIVVWQFAERELAFGDWRPVPLPSGDPTPTDDAGDAPAPGESGPRVVRGTVVARASLPAPGESPYADALFAVRLADLDQISGAALPEDLVVYLRGLEDGRMAPAARVGVGDTVELVLHPWQDTAVQARYAGLFRAELEEDDALFLPAFHGVLR